METITLDEIRKYLDFKQKKKEYNRKYRLAHKEYHAQKVREHRARRKAKAEAESRNEKDSTTNPKIPAN